MAVRARSDPFGARPTVRRRRPVRVVLGCVLLVGGVVVCVAGIVGAVQASARLHDDAVGRSVNGGSAVTFASDGGSYTVYLDFDGLTSNDVVHDLASRDTACVTSSGDSFRGARQGTAMTLGSLVSVGHFAAPAGRVSVRCAYTTGTRSSRVQRPEAMPYLVTPGKPSGLIGTVGLILGGVAGGLLGGWLLFSGLRGKRVPA